MKVALSLSRCSSGPAGPRSDPGPSRHRRRSLARAGADRRARITSWVPATRCRFSCGAIRSSRTTVPVRPDGKISTPLVEDMVAVGKTPSAARARHREGARPSTSARRRSTSSCSNPVSAFSQVKVIGQVTTPQSLPYREGMRVLDAVLAAGGLGPYAAGNRAKIVRQRRRQGHRDARSSSTISSTRAT